MIHASTTTTPPASNPPTSQCFAHNHMTAVEYAVWSVCRALSQGNGKGTLYFSGPKIAERFRSMSKNTPYGVAKSLVESGWFKLLKAPTFRSNGTFSPTQYTVLSHEEWASEHPGCCSDPSHVEGMVSTPFPPDVTPFPLHVTPFPPGVTPSHVEGSNLYKPLIEETNKNTNALSPSQLEGMALIERFGKRGKRKKRKAVKAEATHTEARPFPQNGMAVSNTPMHDTPDDRTPLSASNLEPKFHLDPTRLLNRGHDRGTIQAVANYYRATYGDEIVEREGSSGLEIAFDRLLREMNAQQDLNGKEQNQRKAA